MRLRRTLATTILLPWTLACGGSAGRTPADASAGDVVAPSDDEAGAGADAGASSGTDAGSRTGPCPPSLPEAGAPCDVHSECDASLDCEYGDDPRPERNVLASCVGGKWGFRGSIPLMDTSSVRLADAGCPSTYEEAQNSITECSTPSCSYPDGTCTCVYAASSLGDSVMARTGWSCAPAPLRAGCPPTLAAARANGSCPSNGFACYYPGGSCGCNVTDAGRPWNCVAPPSETCPAARPRLGTACDPSQNRDCPYVHDDYCGYPNGDLFCSCGGLWVSEPAVLCN